MYRVFLIVMSLFKYIANYKNKGSIYDIIRTFGYKHNLSKYLKLG